MIGVSRKLWRCGPARCRSLLQSRLEATFCAEKKDKDEEKKDEFELATLSKEELSKVYTYVPKEMVELINSDKFIAKILR
jgi:hypothetical protein